LQSSTKELRKIEQKRLISTKKDSVGMCGCLDVVVVWGGWVGGCSQCAISMYLGNDLSLLSPLSMLIPRGICLYARI
jgi:hypothetical protein